MASDSDSSEGGFLSVEAVLEKLKNNKVVSTADFDSVLGNLLQADDGLQESEREDWSSALSEADGDNLLALVQSPHFIPLLIKFLDAAGTMHPDNSLQVNCLYTVQSLLGHASKDLVRWASENKNDAYKLCVQIGDKISNGRDPIQQELRVDLLLRMTGSIKVTEPKLAERIGTLLPNAVKMSLQTNDIAILLG